MSHSPTPQPAPGQQPVSRRQALAVGGGLAAVAAAAGSVTCAGPAFAASSDAAAAPLTLRSVSAAQAKAIVVAAEREATRLQVPSFIVVVDVCGDVKGSLRQDGNTRASSNSPAGVPPDDGPARRTHHRSVSMPACTATPC